MNIKIKRTLSRLIPIFAIALTAATAPKTATPLPRADYSTALQTHFAAGTLGATGKSRPIEMSFQKVFKSGSSYSVSGKSKTAAAEDAFSGTLTISSATAGGSCGNGETEIKGSYNLNEKESKTSGYFAGSFTACEKDGKLSKASFNGGWVKHATGGKTPCSFGLGSSIKEMYPKLGREFNEKDEAEYNKIMEVLSEAEWDYDKLTAKQRKLAGKLGVNETTEGYWYVVGGGCSWYCGGGPDSISASSYLKSNNAEITYLPENIHDFSCESAWVEGVAGQGIGEYVTYYFKPTAPRITSVIVVTGYVKSEKAFRENSRVKKLKMYIDDKPTAILNLEDCRREQFFEFAPIGKRPDWDGVMTSERANKIFDELAKLPRWTLKFEILDVYPGDKYEDAAISEIYFDGIDVHCFAAGTQIFMKDNSLKNIELIREGDLVKSYDFKNKKLIDSKVTKLVSAPHSNLLKLKFADNEIVATTDHPFWIERNVWAAADAKKANKDYIHKTKIEKLQIGDRVFMPEKNSFMKILGIEKIDMQQTTYTIELSESDNFIANGMLVKTETIESQNLLNL
ncbi:MAG: hypothetical protein LBH93_01905 [Chitinispirillales bacterium]|jgi:hypothetical protein|nr:hypothetical protein [Chitinispirillales bacterium]